MPALSAPDEVRQLASSLDALEVGLLVLNESDLVVSANNYFRTLFPAAREPLGQAFDAYVGSLRPFIDEEPTSWLSRRNREAASQLTDLYVKDGRVLEVRERALSFGGRVSYWTDVTHRRRQTEQLEDAIGASSDGFAFFSASGGLDIWNNGFSAAFGADMVRKGMRLGDILSRARAANRFTITGDIPPLETITKEPRSRDFLMDLSDGRFARLRLRPTRDGGSVAVLTDLTAERAQREGLARRGAVLADTHAALRESRARIRLQTASLLGLKDELVHARRDADRAETAKHAFLNTVSHELRTPLNAIIGFAEIIQHQIYGPIGSPSYIEGAIAIRDSGQRLLSIINNILDITRLESDVAGLSSDREVLAPLLESAIHDARARAVSAGLDLTLEPVDPNLCVWAEPGALRTVLDNLIDNAITHTPQGGAITVAAQVYESHISIRICDTGAGIAPSDLARILLPFEQAVTNDDVVSAGAGLGLPIVKALVEAMGGAFELTSSLGRGAEAIVTLRSGAPTPSRDPELALEP